jgi:AraC-like DNA-binding protein
MTPHPEILFFVERENASYDPVATLPEEYMPLVLPYAGLYFERYAEADIVSQHKQLGKYFSFWVQEVFTHTDIILCPFTPCNVWVLHFMFEASLQVMLNDDQSIALQDRETNLFNVESDFHRVEMVAGQRMLSCHLNIKPSDLRELAKQYPVLKRLADKQSNGVTGPLNEYPYHLNEVCNFILKRMLSCRHIERPANLFLYRCALELFFNFAQQDQQLPLMLPDVLYVNELTEVFTFILEHPHLTMPIPTLAKAFGLTNKELRDGFLRHYSMRIDAFIRMVKMQLVFDLLTEKSTPLPVIANAAGFEDWYVLDKAFKRYYGCEMEVLRRAM